MLSSKTYSLLSTSAKIKLSKDTNVSSAMQLLLATEDVYIQLGLAKNPNVTPEAQIVLLKHAANNYSVFYDLANNVSITPEAQLMLFQIGLNEIRIAVSLSCNTNCSAEVQLLLIEMHSNKIDTGLACNTSICYEVQKLFLKRNNTSILAYLASNDGNILPEIRWELAKHPETFIKERIALNHKIEITPNFPIKFLKKYKKKYVEEILRQLNPEDLKLFNIFSFECKGSLKDLLEMIAKTK